MNADGSVVTQEFVGLKALSPGALVGTRTNQHGEQVYLPGMNYSRNIGTFKTRRRSRAAQGQTVAHRDRASTCDLTPNQVINMGRVGRAEFQKETGPELAAGGRLDRADAVEDQPGEPRRSGARSCSTTIPNAPFDLNSPQNKWNTIDKDNTTPDRLRPDRRRVLRALDEHQHGEPNPQDPTNTNTPFNHGCTALETASANFERLLIATEIIGFDRVFDPPESLSELSVWGLEQHRPAGAPVIRSPARTASSATTSSCSTTTRWTSRSRR